MYLKGCNMTSKTPIKMTVIMIVTSLLLLTPGLWAQDHDHAEMHASAPADQQAQTLEQVHAKTLPSALNILASLQKAIETGNKEEALTQLNHLKHALMMVQVALAQHVGPTYANTACPIMGTKIDPAKVTADLIREFNGQKVAFCCAMCPAQWDKLTDAEKKTKLMAATAAKPQAMPMSDMHDMHEMHEHEAHTH